MTIGAMSATMAFSDLDEYTRSQLIKNARWAIIGRLTASLFHEINNPMQAIRGAMGLSLEELDDPKSLQDYIHLTLQESKRVITLIARARRVYRPENDRPETFDLNHLIQEVVLLADKEMRRRKIQLETDLDPNLPAIHAVFGELSLAFLCPLLELADILEEETHRITINSYSSPTARHVRITTSATNIPPLNMFVCRDVVEVYGGQVAQQYDEENQAVYVQIDLPLDTSPHTDETTL